MVHKHVKHLSLFPIQIISVSVSIIVAYLISSSILGSSYLSDLSSLGIHSLIFLLIFIIIAVLLHLTIMIFIFNWLKVGDYPHSHIWNRKRN